MSTGNLTSWQSTGGKSASTLVITGSGVIGYIFPTASSSGVIAVYDGTTTAGTNMTGSISMTAGARIDLNLGFGTGCYVNLVSGTGTFFVAYV